MEIINVQHRNSDNILGVIFDLDGVLLDTEKLYARFWREAAVSLGYPMTHQQALGMRSLNRVAGTEKLKSYFPDISYDVVRQRRILLMEQYISEYGVELLPEVEETLSALKHKRIRIAMATSSPFERVERYFGQYGLLDYFAAIVTGYDVEHGKPAPDIYLAAAAKLGLDPQQCFAVEDSPAGITAAHGAGCCALYIPDQDTMDSSIQNKVFAKLDHLMEIIDLLEVTHDGT